MSTFGALLAGHADEKNPMFQHLQACCLSVDDAAQVASLLEAIGGGYEQLRSAQSAWGLPQREHGRAVSAEKMKDALRQKLLALLPPLPLVALWEFVPENARPQLSPYQAVCVPPLDVSKMVRALSCLGTIARNMRDDFLKVCSEWKVTVRHQKRRRSHQELQVDLGNACAQFLAERVDSVVPPAPGAESSASCTLGDLLVGHAEENSDEFRNLKTVVLSPDVVTGVLSLLEVLGGGRQELRAACSVWKIPRTEQGREVSVETLRCKFRQKVVSMLPPVALAVLLQRVPAEITGQFSDYADVFVAAIDVDRVTNLLTFLGSWKEQCEADVVRVCATWGVAVREGNRPRPRQQLATELRGACIRFLKEDVATTVALQSTEAGISVSENALVPEASVENAPAVVSESAETNLGASMVAEARRLPDHAASLQPEDVKTLTTALAMVRQKRVAPRTRVTGKKQAVPAVPADLSQAIESLHEQGTLTWSERKPWMILGGCKEKRKHDGKFVRPSNSLALWETERVLVERLRLQLQVDPECRAAFHGPELLTPRTLKTFADSLKDERSRCITPFGTDFRQVHLPTQWDGQHVLRRLALLEGGLVSADAIGPCWMGFFCRKSGRLAAVALILVARSLALKLWWMPWRPVAWACRIRVRGFNLLGRSRRSSIWRL